MRKADVGFRRIFAQAEKSCIAAACICSFGEGSNQPENASSLLFSDETSRLQGKPSPVLSQHRPAPARTQSIHDVL
jgi:hypothetical protein